MVSSSNCNHPCYFITILAHLFVFRVLGNMSTVNLYLALLFDIVFQHNGFEMHNVPKARLNIKIAQETYIVSNKCMSSWIVF